MRKNTYLIQLAIAIIVIFGGTFTIYYLKTGEFLVDQMIGASVGFILLVASLGWKIMNKQS